MRPSLRQVKNYGSVALGGQISLESERIRRLGGGGRKWYCTVEKMVFLRVSSPQTASSDGGGGPDRCTRQSRTVHLGADHAEGKWNPLRSRARVVAVTARNSPILGLPKYDRSVVRLSCGETLQGAAKVFCRATPCGGETFARPHNHSAIERFGSAARCTRRSNCSSTRLTRMCPKSPLLRRSPTHRLNLADVSPPPATALDLIRPGRVKNHRLEADCALYRSPSSGKQGVKLDYCQARWLRLGLLAASLHLQAGPDQSQSTS